MLRSLLTALLTVAFGSLVAVIRLAGPLEIGGAPPLLMGEADGLALAWLVSIGLIWLFPRRQKSRLRRLAFLLLLASAVGGLLLNLWLPRPPALVELGGGETPPPNDRKTLIVAIDGLSWNRLLPLVAAGKLPNFERLMGEGGYGVLDSLRAPRRSIGREGYWSPVVWTSIATGLRPERHGIVDFSLPSERGGLTLAASHHRKAPAFWNLFSAFGQRVGVVGWWASWPAEEVLGDIASSGLGLRGRRQGRGEELSEEITSRFAEQLTYPPELRAELEAEVISPGDTSRFIDERLFPLTAYPVLGEQERNTFESVIWQDRYFYNVARYLLQRRDYSVFGVYLEGIDLAGHLFWRYRDDPDSLFTVPVPDGFREQARVVDRYYGVVDGYLGGLLDLVGSETTVMVVSDHGFESRPEHEQRADHSGSGVLLVRGPGIRRARDLNLSPRAIVNRLVRDRVDILDVLPTLLYLHQLPISRELDGRPVYELFERSYLRHNPEVLVSSYGDFAATRRVEVEVPEAQREEYLERLRSLGYID